MHCTFKAVSFPDWFSPNPNHPTKSLKWCNVSNIIHWHRVTLASTVFHISYILGSVMHAILCSYIHTHYFAASTLFTIYTDVLISPCTRPNKQHKKKHYVDCNKWHTVLAIIEINSSCLMLIPRRKNKQANKDIRSFATSIFVVTNVTQL